MKTRVWHFDGHSGERRMPTIVPSADETRFLLQGDGAEPGPYAFADLVPQGNSHHERAFGLRDRPGWKITFLEFPPSEIAVQLPKPPRYRAWLQRIGLWRAISALLLLAALGLLVTLKLPPLIARLIPASTGQKMGEAMVASLGSYTCSTPQGDAALRALAMRLGQGDNVRIRVVQAPMINAVAFPGSQVVLFDGLIQDAHSPDEVAGVLAHELGHVAHLDGLETLIRQFGVRMLVGRTESNMTNYGKALLNARYSSKAEAGADGYAIGRLESADISPAATADLLRRLALQDAQPGNADKLLTYLSAHPVSEARERRFSGAVTPDRAYRPALDAAQWQALRAICGRRA